MFLSKLKKFIDVSQKQGTPRSKQPIIEGVKYRRVGDHMEPVTK